MHRLKAQMAESVDALVSNTSGATRAGSTPALGTVRYLKSVVNQVFTTLFVFAASKKRAKSNTASRHTHDERQSNSAKKHRMSQHSHKNNGNPIRKSFR